MAKGKGSAGRSGGGSAGNNASGGSLAGATTAEFASATLAAARATTSGVVGGNKVFISEVFATLSARGAGLSFEEFKGRLVAANEQGRVTLSRADLAYVFDRTTVERSTVRRGNSEFQFIRID